MIKKRYQTPEVCISRFDIAEGIMYDASQLTTAWDKLNEELQDNQYTDFAIFKVNWEE